MTGIKLVRISIHEDDFDKVNNLITYLTNNPEEIGDWEEVREKYGHLNWAANRHNSGDLGYIDAFIERYEFTQLHKYGSYYSDIWKENMNKKEEHGQANT